MRLVFILLFSVVWLKIDAQEVPIELRLAKEEKKLPDNLTSVRTAVILHAPNGQSWKKTAEKVHNQLRQMGIDAIVYLNYRDLTASLQLKNKFIEFLNVRRVENLIFISSLKQDHRLLITSYAKTKNLIRLNATSWYTEAATLNDVLFELALAIKKKEYEFTNFLIPDQPEIFEDMPLFKGTHFPSFPTRIKRLPLAVTKFATYAIDSTQASPQQLSEVKKYNEKIKRKNQQLEQAFKAFPYKYEMTEPITDEEAYRKGYQFVLRHFNTSGENIKKLLNYEINAQETDYISIVPLEGGGRTLKTIPIDEPVYKFYIKQTIAGDVYVGRHWDAAVNWEEALKNFLLHMKNDFEK